MPEGYESLFLECDCFTPSHTVKFEKIDEELLLLSVQLHHWKSWYARAWQAIKYVFGFMEPHGHWDTFVLQKQDADKLIKLLESYNGK